MVTSQSWLFTINIFIPQYTFTISEKPGHTFWSMCYFYCLCSCCAAVYAVHITPCYGCAELKEGDE